MNNQEVEEDDISESSDDENENDLDHTHTKDDILALAEHSSALSALSAASTEQAFRLNPNVETVVLYKGRKYNWNAKINLHVHIVDHPYANTIEVIGYNTNNFSEADHIYISSSYVYQKSDDPEVEDKVDMVLLEYQKLKVKIIPSVDTIKDALQQQRAATYILDRLHVVSKPTFHIDIKESDKNYRISSNNPKPVNPNDRRPSIEPPSLADSSITNTISLALKKPDMVIPSHVKRVGKSTTLIGDVVSVKLVKEDEQLQKIIATLNSSSFNNQAKKILNRVSLMQRNSSNTNGSAAQASTIANLRRRGGIFQASNVQNTANLKFFAKMKNDNDLLQESLSFLHVSDMMEMTCVCKRWQQVLTYALKSTSAMVITSKDYYHNCNLDRDIILNRLDYTEARHRRLRQLATAIVTRPNTKGSVGGRTPKSVYQHNRRMRNSNQMDDHEKSSDGNYDTADDEWRRHSFDSVEENFVDDYHQHLAQSSNHGLTSNYHNHNNLLVMPDRQEWPMLKAPNKIEVRKIFCRPETIQSLIRNASRSIVELRLHYVVLNRDVIASLSSLTGRLKTLILGTIKMDDTVREIQAVESTNQDVISTSTPRHPGAAKPPDQSVPSQRSVLSSHGRKLVGSGMETGAGVNRSGSSVPSTPHSVTTATTPNARTMTPVVPAQTQRPPSKPRPVRYLRFMDSNDLGKILYACGSGLTRLEVPLTLGDIPTDILQLVPNLTHFSVQGALIAPNLVSAHDDIDGNVPLDDVYNTLMGIPMPDLLTLMSDSTSEAFCLTDRRGKIVAVNSPWEKIFGYSRVDIVGSNLDFLGGPLTNRDDFNIILQGLKNQLRAEEIIAFLYTKDERPVLIQTILLPNLTKWKGLPLNFDCLEQDFIGEMALEQEEAQKLKSDSDNKKLQQQKQIKFEKGKRDWRAANRELSYHLLRFGVLSSSFAPYQQAAYAKRR